jgi:uncharacterized protein (DUF924 family)
MQDWIDETLGFWFEELTPQDWFEVRPKTDETIRERFGGLYERIGGAVPEAALKDVRAARATIIVYDQFPRNMFRGDARAFATDGLALSVSRNAVEKGFDSGLGLHERQFLYMPFMHSEDLADQERSVELFETTDENTLKYAVEHRDIIARFGRFPHRNRALGRESTPDEKVFLGEHKGYGQ